MTQMGKNLPAIQETHAQPLDLPEDLLQVRIANDFRILELEGTMEKI